MNARYIAAPLLALVSILASPPSVSATSRTVLECPTWSLAFSGITHSPAAAMQLEFNHEFPGCPGTANCTAPYFLPTTYSCTETYVPGGACPAAGATGSPTYAFTGPIVLSDGTHDHCVNPASEDPKNLGRPCPACGNPINPGTGNKYEAETDQIGRAHV